MNTSKERISRLFEETCGGYSFDRYTESGWRGCIVLLAKHGMTDSQIVDFMLSKHMRWAGDSDFKRDYGQHNSATLRDYIAKCPNAVSASGLCELVDETF